MALARRTSEFVGVRSLNILLHSLHVKYNIPTRIRCTRSEQISKCNFHALSPQCFSENINMEAKGLNLY